MNANEFQNTWDDEEYTIEQNRTIKLRQKYMAGNNEVIEERCRATAMQTYDPPSNWGRFHGWGGKCNNCGMAHIIPPHGDHFVLRMDDRGAWDRFWHGGRRAIALCPICNREFILDEPAQD